MHDAASQPSQMTNGDATCKCVKGAIHFLNRTVPLIFEDKEFFMRAMWHEQSFFNNQINATQIMDAICILLFKQGFTIMPLKEQGEPNYFGKFVFKKFEFCISNRRRCGVEGRYLGD